MKPFQRMGVAAMFEAYPEKLREKLLFIRALIFEVAAKTEGVGAIEETLKWGQPSYLTSQSGSGSTIRIDRVGSDKETYAVFFHCQTNLVPTFRKMFGRELSFGGNRSIVLKVNEPVPEAALRVCIGLALTYHLEQ